MSNLDASTLLSLWESGAGDLLLRRTLALLPAAYPERSAAEWARVAIGERDARLLDLKEALFGPKLEMLAPCPKCGDMLELSFQTGDVRAQHGTSELVGHLQRDGYEVEYRTPNSEDVLNATSSGSVESTAEKLLESCILSARHQGEDTSAASLPENLRADVEQAIAQLDPGSECKVALECTQCGHCWSELFDIASYLWSELDDWAQRTLRDIHTLASAYSWSEREILALTPTRRQLYVEMATGGGGCEGLFIQPS